MTLALTDKRVPTPFPRLTYRDAMALYGTDKPDLRYGLASVDLSPIFPQTEFGVFREALVRGGVVRGLRVPGGARYSRREIDELVELGRDQGARGVAWAILDPGELRSSFTRFLSAGEQTAMIETLEGRQGDLLLLVADAMPVPSRALGAIRIEVARRDELAPPDVLAYARITEFPLVEWSEQEHRWDAVHHPFTSPLDEDMALLEERPGEVRAKAYDLVCNGWELGSGSIRIHQRDTQQRVFRLLGYTDEQVEDRFGHLLRAFQHGTPPHGGMAPGIDRTVALFAGEQNIREVIAFPKNQAAVDLMMSAPAAVAEEQLDELHIALRLPEPP
jgi:aspartyl-tRNA synthetase